MRFPPDFTYPAQKQVTAQVAAQSIAGLAADHRVVVQAGGCAGLWPLALAHYFDRVVTCEPAPDNFDCLAANIADRPNIAAFGCALGDTVRSVSLTRPKAQAGLWRVDGDGDTPMTTIDVLVDGPVDAIVLDVEGSEVAALQGAERVIAEHRPLLWFEFLHHVEALTDWLTAHDYTMPAHGVESDWYSVHASRVA